MAFIPDDAIDAATELSPSAFRLYCLICRRRNHKSGHALLTSRSIQNSLQLSRGQTYRAIRELSLAKWISVNEPFFVPIFGDFSPVNKWHDNTNSTTPAARKNETKARKNVTKARKNETAHLYSYTSLINQPLNTKPQGGDNIKTGRECFFCGNEPCFESHMDRIDELIDYYA